MVILGGSSSPPLVPISKLASVDGGTEVRIQGLLVELWSRDDGSEALVLLDAASQATARVYSSQGIDEQPSRRAGIGDLLLVQGEVSGALPSPAVYSQSDSIAVLRAADLVMTVDILADCWTLFEGDTFRICGILATDTSTGSSRLFDSSGERSVALHFPELVESLSGSRVVVEGRLLVDECHMFIYMDVESISRAF